MKVDKEPEAFKSNHFPQINAVNTCVLTRDKLTCIGLVVYWTLLFIKRCQKQVNCGMMFTISLDTETGVMLLSVFSFVMNILIFMDFLCLVINTYCQWEGIFMLSCVRNVYGLIWQCQLPSPSNCKQHNVGQKWIYYNHLKALRR